MKPEQRRNQILCAELAWIRLALAGEQAVWSRLHSCQLPLSPSNFVVYVVCTVFSWVLLSENMHLDGFRGGWRLSALVSHLLLAVALVMVLLLAVENVSGRYAGRLTLSLFSLFLLIGFLAIRWVALKEVLRRYQKGNVHRVVILGSDRLATELAETFNHHPDLCWELIGLLGLAAEASATRPRHQTAA